ncbi:DNA-binding response regulator, OmpR family, contains REC and winged-helix (wHTH) domain [Microlunatus sagamiharensis]|uniref:DNA-binding response regulator, OmpR family, contains REC and winged-helix (WHTH) domain n=1 Tax=Microlunatus sagamiharensis TaxID=546874 RepID=A0A1H2MY44_9ACTN|nr:response regulator transcription factor [Microlunatus sagamiharensis]SDU98014.1 DNA-binding response regulator, OmpR family, contains REC and winged-helix (wHTH) domain [Microlunatus sagamiharensis]
MRVLLVEDEALLARTVVAGLVAEGFRVDHHANGVDGLWAATENHYDVVVLDIMLPGLNGYDVLKRLRAREVWTPVLMLTAKDGEYDQTDAFELGADDYLTKPFTFSLLVARLHALARRGPGTRPTVLKVGSLALDPVRRTVHRGATEVPLTAREFGLLEYLARNAGATLTKGQILDNVWDPAFEGGMNVVEIYVGYLRRKIDEPFGLSTLTTIRGVGYRLVADDTAEPVRVPSGPLRGRGARR